MASNHRPNSIPNAMALSDPRKIVVAEGYNAVAKRYLEWDAGVAVRNHYLEQLSTLVPAGGRVLDLGCGPGVPVARKLVKKTSVVGVDISAKQFSLARQNVPEAHIIHADMMALDFPEASFDGIAAFYSLIHLPRGEHAEMLRRIMTWLRPGGVFIASMGVFDSNDDIEEDWLGAPMFFSHFNAATSQQLVRNAGFEPFHEELVEQNEDDAIVRFLWIMARKPAQWT